MSQQSTFFEKPTDYELGEVSVTFFCDWNTTCHIQASGDGEYGVNAPQRYCVLLMWFEATVADN